MSITQIIGNRIHLMRKANGMTQRELAGRLGVTSQAVSRWECGICTPDISLLISISRAFGISVDYLCGLR